ncbi:MAG: hypothetical protein KA171_26195 [Reyranella sp.]|nr:hypothetical protein [Reyranella sp.]
MSLLDVLTGMRNGPRGGRSGGMSPITMALLGLLAYKAVKGFGGAKLGRILIKDSQILEKVIQGSERSLGDGALRSDRV